MEGRETVTFGSLLMMDVGEQKRKNFARLCGKKWSEETPTVLLDSLEDFVRFDGNIFQIWCFSFSSQQLHLDSLCSLHSITSKCVFQLFIFNILKNWFTSVLYFTTLLSDLFIRP